MKKSFSLFFILCSLFFFSQISEQKLDELIQNTIKTFDVPGMSVGILKDGKVIYSKGFGVRSLNNNLPMTPETLVGIASNSKGFTCTALAILADEGKLDWDDKVTKFLPDFKMYDDYVTQELTIKDLATHRAGFRSWTRRFNVFSRRNGTMTTEQLLHNVRYLKPAHSFRNMMDYNNVMFIVAGEVIHKISGKTWAEFIEERIMKP
ncbi:MAG: serine hydrolase domain-containing protein [Cloacibacterium normanense]